MKYKIIEKVFGPVLKKPCWNVRSGQWESALGFEFGKPSLEIIERKEKSSGKKPFLKKRTVVLSGEWGLRFEFCSWSAYLGVKKIGDGGSKEVSDKVVREFSGQALKDIIIKPETGESTFVFDLGGWIETSPKDDDDQWDFRTPLGKYLTYRGDGMYSYERGDMPTPDAAWKRFRV